MERRQLITREEVVNELKRSDFSDFNLSTIVHSLSSLVDILRNNKEEFSEFDQEDLQLYAAKLETAMESLDKDIIFNLRHYKYIPTMQRGLMIYSRTALSFIIIVLINILLSSGNVAHSENTEYFKAIRSIKTDKTYRQIEGWAYNGQYNPRYHRFYDIFKRDSQQVFDLMEAGISFITEERYDLAYYAFQNMLVHLRGVAKET